MSFQPQRLGTFMRMPPGMSRGIRMSRRMPTKLAPTGILALVAAGLAGVAYFKTTHHETVDKIVILGAVVLAVVGGALALVKQEVGAPIAAGAVTPFIGSAASLVGSRIAFSGALHSLESKLYLGAGIVGMVLAVIVLIDLTGRGNPALGTLIALLAVIPPVCFAAIAHIDDAHPAPVVAAVLGEVIIAVIIAVGGLKGRFGAVVSVVAGGLLLPPFIRRAQDFDDRKPAALAAVLALILIVVLGLILAIMAAVRDAAEARIPLEEEPALITANWQPISGAVAPTPPGAVAPSAVGVNPLAPPALAQPRVGAVVQPVSAPMVPVEEPTNGRWATDPYGRYQVRYWNGKKWTHHVSTNGITGSDPIE